ncbi:putative prophage antirepressor [Mannheimia haemolytica serotype A2 str. BOVINE]|nr:putative prophage antirepressor [Mannheimia haemolytica serotype A2 str. BOVINE]
MQVLSSRPPDFRDFHQKEQTMTTQISTFNFKSNPVRIEIIKNEPYFCLVDVCLVMNIQNSRRVNADMLNQEGVRKAYVPTTSGNQELTFINEPNLYRIIFKSRKAEAVEFQNWVFEEVLPQIRKTGKYQAQQQLALPEPPKKYQREFTKSDLEDIAWCWFEANQMCEFIGSLKPALQALGSNLYPKAHSMLNTVCT